MVRGAVTTAIIAILLSAQAVESIKEINPITCAFSTKYFKVFYQFERGKTLASCFADSGDIDIAQGAVTAFSSGNNAGYFDYEPGDGGVYRHSFEKNTGIDTGPGQSSSGWGKITRLHIR